jgi:hypothetical protein
MQARSPDTDADAEAVQIELLRKAGGPRRARLALSLSATVIALARSAIRRSFPNASEEEVGLRFVQLHYGRDLASELRTYLAARRR